MASGPVLLGKATLKSRFEGVEGTCILVKEEEGNE